MVKNHRKTEGGQALVLLVFAFVGLLAFAALAIDGGMIYSDRRIAQNASDAAAMAGAGAAAQQIKSTGVDSVSETWDCNAVKAAADAQAIQAAINSAKSNDFIITGTASATTNYVKTACAVDHYDVIVQITDQTPTTFAHYIFKGPLVNTVGTVGRINPRVAVGNGNAIVSLNQAACSGTNKGTLFDGTSDIDISGGGGVWSNSCIFKNGISGTVNVYTGTVDYQDTYYANPGSIVPTPTQETEPLVIQIPPPDCSSLSTGTTIISGTTTTISPGIYNNITLNNSSNVTMNPGLYCVSGDFRINGGVLTGDGVTIYLTGSSSTFSSSGGASIQLSAPPPGCEDTPGQYPGCPPSLGGMLIYMATGGSQGISLLGDSSSNYEGTVYAPNNTIDVGGTGNLENSFGVQVIGENVRIHGTSQLNIVYDPSQLYHLPTSYSLYK